MLSAALNSAALVGGFCVVSFTNPAEAACSATAPAGFSAGYECSAAHEGEVSVDVAPGAGVVVNSGASVLRSGLSNTTSAINFRHSPGAELILKSSSLVENKSSKTSSKAVFVRTTTTGLKITVDPNATLRTNKGVAIKSSLNATGTIVNNSGLIEATGATSASAILLHDAVITNEASGIIQSKSSTTETIKLEDSGTLVNKGLIQNTGGSFAIEGGGGSGTNVEHITNAGTISTTGATAIALGSEDDIMELHIGSIITGTVDGGDDTDILRFGGSGTDSFGLDLIGSQYINFETFEQTSGTWKYSGTTTENFNVTGGTLAGAGTFANLSLSGATIAPGDGIATTTVTGDFLRDAGSTYQVDVTAQGQSDLIDVTGSATIGADVTLDIQGALESYPTTELISTIITSDDSVSGTFATVFDNLPDVDFTVEYRENDVRLKYSVVPQVGSVKTFLSPKDIHSAAIAGAQGADLAFLSTLLQSPTTNRQNLGPNQRLDLRDLQSSSTVSTQGVPPVTSLSGLRA